MRISSFILLLFSQDALAVDCDKAVTTLETNECAAIEQHKVEAQLNDTYKRVIRQLDQADPESDQSIAATKKALIEAQRAWVKFREADCNALYELYRDGTIRTVMYIGCMQAHAEQRIKELKEYEPK